MRAKETAFHLGFGKRAVFVRVPNHGLYQVKKVQCRKDGHMTITLGALVNEERLK